MRKIFVVFFGIILFASCNQSRNSQSAKEEISNCVLTLCGENDKVNIEALSESGKIVTSIDANGIRNVFEVLNINIVNVKHKAQVKKSVAFKTKNKEIWMEVFEGKVYKIHDIYFELKTLGKGEFESLLTE